MEEADGAIGGDGLLLGGVELRLRNVAEGEVVTHVGLATAEPDFADRDVLKRFHRRTGGDPQRADRACGELGELQHPAILTGRDRVGGGEDLALRVEVLGLDVGSGRGPSPQGDGLSGLENHVIPDEVGQAEIVGVECAGE